MFILTCSSLELDTAGIVEGDNDAPQSMGDLDVEVDDFERFLSPRKACVLIRSPMPC